MRGATNGKYPKYIIWENVAGAFSSNKGQDFRRVLEEITKTYIPMPNSRRWATSGMVRSAAGSTAWRQLDAQYWGVPQRRKRIYLVHNFNGERAPEILFECESVLGYTAQGRTEGKNITGGAGNSVEATGTGTAAGFLPLNSGRANGVGYEDEKSPTLTNNPPATVYTIAGNAIGRMGRNGGNQLGVGQDISYTLTAADRLHSPGKHKVSRSLRRRSGRAYKLCIPQIGSAGRRRGQKTGQNVPGIHRGHNRSCSASA